MIVNFSPFAFVSGKSYIPKRKKAAERTKKKKTLRVILFMDNIVFA